MAHISDSGTAWVKVRPDTDSFAPEATAGIRAAMAQVKDPNVDLTVNQSRFAASLGQAAVKLAAFDKLNGTVNLKVDSTEALMSAETLRSQLEALMGRVDNIPVTLDDSAALAKILALQTALAALYTKADVGGGPMDFAGSAATFYKLQAQAETLEASLSHLDAEISAEDAFTKLTSMTGEADVLKADLANLRANVNDTDLVAKIAAAQVKASALSKSLMVAPVGSDFGPLESQLLNLQSSYSKLVTASEAADEELDKSGDIAKKAASGWFSLNGVVANLGAIHIPLFATSMQYAEDAVNPLDNGLAALGKSFLTTASGAHLVSEAAIELVAVWGPAALALTLFGLAAAPTVKNIATGLENLNTTTEATGHNFDILSKSGDSLTAAVKPQVMQLFGDALLVANSGSGELTKSLTAVGSVLDQMGAKVVQFFQSSSGGTFLSKAASDVAGLGDAFQQIGRIIGTLLQAVPGYAEILLKLGDAALTVGADAVQGLEPAIALFLKLHGAVFYLGLASTLVGTFGKAAVTAFAQVATGGEKMDAATNKLSGLGQALGNASGALFAMGGAAVSWVKETGQMVGEFGIAETAGVRFGEIMEAIPFGPVGLAVGVVAALLGGALYLAFNKSADAATKLNIALEKNIASSSIINVQQNLLAATKATTAAMQQQASVVTTQPGAIAAAAEAGVRAQQQNMREYEQSLQQYANQSATAALRTDALSKSYGNAASVMQLMTLAGVKQGDIATANASAWAQDEIQLEATAKAYGVFGQQAGAAGNQLDTLTISTGNTTKAVQTLVSAEQAWITLITGGDSGFDAFIQGNQTLASAMAAGSAAGTKLTTTSGKLTEQQKLLATNLQGTSVSALAARQAFDSQLSSGVTLFGNLQNLAAASGNTAQAQSQLAAGGKAIIATLLPFVSGSKEATSELSGLAQLMGGPATDSFQVLSKWVGSTKNATDQLNNAQYQLTLTSNSLSKAAQNLGNVLGSDVTASQASAILSTQQFTKAQNDLITATEASKGKLTDTAVTAAGTYYESMIKAGLSTQDATQYVNALLGKLGDTPAQIEKVDAALKTLPSKVTVSIQEELSGSGKILASVNGLGVTLSSAPANASETNLTNNASLTHAQSGMLVRGSGPAGKDSVHLFAAPGELVIPTSHAAKYGAMAKADGIPMASGGFVGGSVPAAQTGIQAAGQAMVAMTQNAMTQLVGNINNASAAIAGGPLGPGGGSDLANMAAGMRYLAQYLFHGNLRAAAGAAASIAGESGWNPFAQGTGGRGLIGWTPPSTVSNAAFAGGLSTQLPAIIQFVRANGDLGVIAEMITAANENAPIATLAQMWGKGVERYGINDVHATGVTEASSLLASLSSSNTSTTPAGSGGMARGGRVKPYSAGGMITEPVAGVGLNSGTAYSFGENGNEAILNQGQMNAMTGPPGMPGATQYGQQTTNQLLQQVVKLLQQAPAAQARAVNSGMAKGAIRVANQ